MKHRRSILASGCLFMVLAASFAVWTPPFMYPDEPTHLAGCLETRDPAARELLEQTILKAMHRHNFWHRADVETPVEIPEKFYHAPLLRVIPTQFAKPTQFYAAAGFLLRLLHIETIVGAVYFLRCIGLILAGISMWVFCLIVRIVFPESSWQTVALAALAVPQYVYMAGAFNPSNTAWLTGGLFLLSALWLLDPKRRFHGFALLAVALALTTFTHRAALAVLPAVAIAIPAGRRRLTRHMIPVWLWPVAGIVCVGSAVILAYGHPLAVRTVFIRLAAVLRQTGVSPVASAMDPAWWMEFIPFFWRSTILNFGWLSQDAPGAIYWLYSVIAGVGILGWCLSGLRFQRHHGDRDIPRNLVLWTAVMGMIWAAAARYAVSGYFAQGRYLFAAWPAFACLTAMGWRRCIPERMHGWVFRAGVPIIWLLAAWSLWWIWIPGVYF